jgi:hypothetical protein
MSDLDLTAAIDTAARHAHVAQVHDGHDEWCAAGPDEWETARARLVIAAAAPLIAAQVREQIAQEIEAVDDVEWALAGMRAGQDAARIARGGAR